MCAIIGAVNLKKRPVKEKILWEMTDSLSHRGPDDRGVHIDNFLGLGHRRLSIIDLSPQAHQPMSAQNRRYWIVYNGEVYNFRQLRRKLESQGVRFFSHSDTEVVLKSFVEWGPRCFKMFNGMFSLAIWDKREKTLILARDRYGIKPLYYWADNNVFLFASEIKAFLKHPQFRVQLDTSVLLEYFTFQNTFTYKTLFKGVKLLEPGHFMRIGFKDRVSITVEKYWDFSFREDKSLKKEEECIEELDRLFKRAVKRQLVADVEIGSFLSGGIDSGSITSISSRYFKELKTFCIGFDLSSVSGLEISFDERKKAERLSYIYQTEHYQMVLKSGDLRRCLPQLVWHLEDLRLGQSYPNFYASKLASRFVKVCLSGAGGDELFAGYPWRYYRALRSKSFNEYIDGYYKYWQRLVPNSILKKLFSPIWSQVKHVWTEDIFRSVLNGHRILPQTPQDYINQSLYFEAKTFLHGLLIVEDKLSMAHSLEVRVPFLDDDLVDFATRIPVRFKLRDIGHILKIDEDELAKRDIYFQRAHDGKIILRKVLSKYVPQEITSQYKQGFTGPDASWFRGESIDYVREKLLNKKARVYNYLDYRTSKELINEHLKGKFNRRLFIWSMLCFEEWLKMFF